MRGPASRLCPATGRGGAASNGGSEGGGVKWRRRDSVVREAVRIAPTMRKRVRREGSCSRLIFAGAENSACKLFWYRVCRCTLEAVCSTWFLFSPRTRVLFIFFIIFFFSSGVGASRSFFLPAASLSPEATAASGRHFPLLAAGAPVFLISATWRSRHGNRFTPDNIGLRGRGRTRLLDCKAL